MDKMDRRIIDILQGDGRLTSAAVASQVGVSEETVRRRILAMVQRKDFQLVAIPNPEKFGFDCQAMLAIRVIPAMVDQVAEALASVEEIQTVSIVSGSFDILAQITLRSLLDLKEFLSSNLMHLDGVQTVETFITLSEVKRTHALKVGP